MSSTRTPTHLIERLSSTDTELDASHPVLLFDDGSHSVYWLGIDEETVFRCNTYLIKDQHEALLIDPGNRRFFGKVLSNVKEIADPRDIKGMILCHQDPDVAASMVDWLELEPDMLVL